jgi:hypothetical protein
MKVRTVAAAAAFSVLGLALVAQSTPCGPGRCACGQGKGMAMGGGAPAPAPLYDPDTVTTVRGIATAVTVVPARGGRTGGMHLTLESAGQAVEVHLGPAWFLRGEGIEVASGDAVEVTGSLVDSDGQSFLVARELKKGEKVVKLRDAQGVPVWAAGPRSR